MNVTYIERDGQLFAVIPADTFERMLDDLDDLDDIRLYDAAKAQPQEYIPADIVDRLIDGENPVRVWREHRGLTAAALAVEVKIAAPYLSQIEHGRRQASQAVLRRLATALKVDVDDLIGREPEVGGE
jgi:ribosome-binding protein aMBF1 (putative translation factor)